MSDKILRLHIESYMGLNDVKIDWEKYAIMGVIADGGAGKTSLIDFLRSALTGIIPDKAINVFNGKAKGSLDFIKNGIEYTARFSKTKNSDSSKNCRQY
jgi:DNA repair exonuclease SbcCD ATPase subunit